MRSMRFLALGVALCWMASTVRAADVFWNGPTTGSWTDVANWTSSPVLPGAADDVTLDNQAANITVTLNLEAPDIGSFVLAETLNISGGSLNVVGESTLNAGANLNLSNGGSYSGGGAATIAAANLSAQSGGTIALPEMNAITHTDPGYTRAATIAANGPGSSIDLSGTTMITGNGMRNSPYNFNATGGGVLDLGALQSIAGGAVNVEITGSESQIDLASLNAANQANFRARQGASLTVPITAIVNDVAEGNRTMELLTSGAGGRLDLPNATEITSSTERNSFLDLTASNGATLNAPQITRINDGLVRITADHAEVQLPLLAEVASGRTVFEARGADSVLNTNALAAADSATFNANGGAQIAAPLMTSYSHVTDANNDAANIWAHGSGGLVDLSGVTTLTGNVMRGSVVNVRALKRGRVDLSAATEIAAGAFIIQADDGEVDLSSLTSIADGDVVLEAIGTSGNVVAPNLASVFETDVIARGGADVSLPALTNYLRNVDTNNSPAIIRAEGRGSSIQIPLVAEMDASNQRGSQTSIEAVAGGEIDWNGLTALNAGAFNLLADRGVIRLPMLANVAQGDDVLGKSVFETRGADGAIEAPNLAATRGASLIARDGAEFTAPSLATYLHDTQTNNEPASIISAGSGSRVTLANLPGVTSNATRGSGLRIEASAGGAIDLPAATNFNGGAIDVVASGAGSTIDLSQLDAIDEGMTRFEVRGASASINLDALTTANDAGFEAHDGAELNLPALTTYNHPSQTANSPVRWIAAGVGSRVAAPALTTMTSSITRGSQVELTATGGGEIDLSSVAQIDEGLYAIQASGVGSVVDLSALTNTMQTAAANTFSTVNVSADGLVRFHPTETTLQHTEVSLSTGGRIEGGLMNLTGRSQLRLNGELDASVVNEGVTRLGGDGLGAAAINGDFTQTETGEMQMQVGGDEAGVSFDVLHVTGDVQLAGDLAVSLVREFRPELGEAFEFITAASVSGEFASGGVLVGDVMLAPGVVGNSVVLLTAVPGDLDLNGAVDLIDFNAMKENFEVAGVSLAEGDVNNDGAANLADFNVLKANFGAQGPSLADYGAGASAIQTAAVPEPASWALLATAVAAFAAMRVARRDR